MSNANETVSAGLDLRAFLWSPQGGLLAGIHLRASPANIAWLPADKAFSVMDVAGDVYVYQLVDFPE